MTRTILQVPFQGQLRRTILINSDLGPKPLVIGLHGGGSNPDQFERQSRLSIACAERGWHIAYPSGTGWGSLLTWNAQHCCGVAKAMNVDDVGFLDALITLLRNQIGPTHVFIAGFSNGAMMALRAACELLPGVIQGVCSSAGSTWFEPTYPIPAMFIHGLDDDHVPILGGIGPAAYDQVNHRALSITANLFRAQYPDTTIQTTQSGIATIEHSKDGDGVCAVEVAKLDGVGHQWTYPFAYDAARNITRFFAEHVE